MRDAPLASIVISSCNYARFLPQAIESALAQAYAQKEVIVVDDGSRDESLAVISSYGSRIAAVLKDNGGQCSAVNAGFAASRGEVVCFLDADDALMPETLSRAVPLLRTPGTVKVHWALSVIDVAGAPLGRLTPPAPLAEGDLRETVIRCGPDSYVSPPTSGNCWSRGFLERMLPIPTETYRTAADAYLELLAPFFGPIRRLNEPGGLYRVHGANSSGRLLFSEQVRMLEERSARLSAYLTSAGVPFDLSRWQRPMYQWHKELAAIGEELAPVIPPGDRYILVDDDQWGQGRLMPKSEAIPFLEREGQYWGAPPDAATAIQELKRLMRVGARFIVFAAPAFWWLAHYGELADFLTRSARVLLANERIRVYQLLDTN